MNLLVAFLTGLTAGGLSCLAVQGGLLASSLAHQLELDLADQAASPTGGGDSAPRKLRPRLAQPIALFLGAKLVAYTLLGVLLGALGSVLELTPTTRAILLIAIGIFMLGNGLRMLRVHPIFRYFAIEPPAVLTRYIRRTSKNGTNLFTPLFLGAMTVLIPCGIAQAMMAAALGTGSPLQGAMLMFAFTLGTTPVFFAIAYFATRLGARLERNFTRIVALVVIVLGLVSMDAGLNLAGSPVSFSKLSGRLTAAPAPSPTPLPVTAAAPAPSAGAPSPAIAATPAQNGYVVNVGDRGYSPKVLHLAANRSVRLVWASKDVRSCALAVVVPALNYQKLLPATGLVNLDIPAQKKGTVMNYSCSMGMYTGQLVFDLD